ncbi:hypothetical protein GB937_009128 [Aspergillus fischeri]|nr:hypothetical protein GB937_009128 [Aspergillus fischeri]
MKIAGFLWLSLLGASIATGKTHGVVKRSTVSEILAGIKNTVTCAACEVEDSDICEGAIAQEGPILAHDLRNMDIPSTATALFCTTIFGLCDYPAVSEYAVDFPSAKPMNASRPSPSGGTPIQVVDISDIHVDLSYETSTSYNCTRNICCQPYTLSDAPGNTSYPAGEFGDHSCDTPLSLEESMYAAIQELVPNAAFTIFTGDVVEGAVWLVNETELNLVYGVIGNHDTAPVNCFPPADINTTISSQWAYDTLASDWTQWIGSTAATTVQDYGAYSVKYPDGNLRIISFHTNLYYKENFWLYEKSMETDPSGQLAWLVNELDAAETAGERVWLLGHMPMGWHTLSKLVLCVVMLRGRLRGLPVTIDKAILLPVEHLIQAEQEDAHIRLERTMSRSRSRTMA